MTPRNKGLYRYRVPIGTIRIRQWVRKQRRLRLAFDETFIQRRINEELAAAFIRQVPS